MANETGTPADFRGMGAVPVVAAGETTRSVEVLTGGSLVEAVDGIAAIVLAILGLAGIVPFLMAAIATIVLGVALLSEGGAIAARYSQLLARIDGGHLTESEIGGGMSAEILGGIAAIVLGILALLHMAPWTLMSCAIIVIGASLLLGSGATSRLSAISAFDFGTQEHLRRVARESVMAAASAGVFVGLGGIVLGILALLGIQQLMLALVGLLVLGVGVLLSGAAISSKMMAMLRR